MSRTAFALVLLATSAIAAEAPPTHVTTSTASSTRAQVRSDGYLLIQCSTDTWLLWGDSSVVAAADTSFYLPQWATWDSRGSVGYFYVAMRAASTNGYCNLFPVL